MNCSTCGLEYRDDVPHPPSACATHAGEELKKAREGLDGALEAISVKNRELAENKALVRRLLRPAKGGKDSYRVIKDPEAAAALMKWASEEPAQQP